MTPHYSDDWLTVYHGDARAVMAELPAESVHCVVTSPPYWGLRDYGVSDQLGLEPTPEQYVENMVAVFREVRRVLRSDGTVWLNLGDSYASSGVAGEQASTSRLGTPSDGTRVRMAGGVPGPNPKMVGQMFGRAPTAPGLKPKDLVGIPWRVAFAIQADGWYLRSDIIWSKLNPMPESVTDRPTKSHEYLFLLSKSARYYYDADAVREPLKPGADHDRPVMLRDDHRGYTSKDNGNGVADHVMQSNPAGRNLRSVWSIATAPYPGAHFATFPPKLVEPCIKAGTSEKGVCPECGAPWVREVERPEPSLPAAKGPKGREYGTSDVDRRSSFHVAGWREAEPDIARTTGWRPSCSHVSPLPPRPATVLDPFAGSGTTGMMAQSLSRRAILIDLSLDYLGQLMDRNREVPLGL